MDKSKQLKTATGELVVNPLRSPSNVQHVQLAATDAASMAMGQEHMVEFFIGRLREAEAEVAEAERNVETAENCGFQMGSFKRHLSLARRMVRFYEKCSVVVKAGHALVPNFPADVFAVRTDRDKPKAKERYNQWQPGNAAFIVDTVDLSLGEGEYVDSDPLVDGRIDSQWKKDEKTGEWKSNTFWKAIEFQDVHFPDSTRNSDVMIAVHQAMDLKAFDDFGVLPDRRERQQDPIIVGRVKDPRRHRSHLPLCFMVAWYVDTRTI